MLFLPRVGAVFLVCAVYALEPARYHLYAFSLSLVHYGLAIFYSKKLFRESVSHGTGRIGWALITGLIVAGISLNTTLSFVVLFGVHHVLTETYEPLSARPWELVLPRAAFHTSVYLTACASDFRFLGISTVTFLVVTTGLFILLTASVLLFRKERDDLTLIAGESVFLVAAGALVLFPLTPEPRMPLLFGLYHVFFWILSPVTRRREGYARQFALNIFLSAAATLALYDFTYSGPDNFRKVFTMYMIGAYIHACTSLALSRLNPVPVLRIFHRSSSEYV